MDGDRQVPFAGRCDGGPQHVRWQLDLAPSPGGDELDVVHPRIGEGLHHARGVLGAANRDAVPAV